MSRRKVKAIMSDDRRQKNHRLLQSKAHADAGAWARSKRQISETIDRLALARHEARRIEMIGVSPQGLMTMEHIRRNDDERPGLNLLSRQRVRSDCLAAQRRRWRIETHRLVERRSHARQALDLRGFDRPLAEHRIDFAFH